MGVLQEPESPKSPAEEGDGGAASDELQVTAVTRKVVPRKVIEESFSEDVAREMHDKKIKESENEFVKTVNENLNKSVFNGIAHWHEMSEKNQKKAMMKQRKKEKKAKKKKKLEEMMAKMAKK